MCLLTLRILEISSLTHTVIRKDGEFTNSETSSLPEIGMYIENAIETTLKAE